SEKELVDQVLEIRRKLRGTAGTVEGTQSKLEAATEKVADEIKKEAVAEGEKPVVAAELSDAEREELLTRLNGLQSQLAELQGESPLILPTVDAQAVASVVADWTGIPVGRMVRNEIETILKLTDTLNQRVIVQRHALEMIARRIQTSRAGLDNPSKPIGVFLL